MIIDGEKISGYFSHHRVTTDVDKAGRLCDIGQSVIFNCAKNVLPKKVVKAFNAEYACGSGPVGFAMESVRFPEANQYFAAAYDAITMSSDDMYYCDDDADQPIRQLYAYTDECRAKYGQAPLKFK